MPNTEDYVNAAKKAPSKRSTAEQALVDKGKNLQSVRNADFKARQEAKRHGS